MMNTRIFLSNLMQLGPVQTMGIAFICGATIYTKGEDGNTTPLPGEVIIGNIVTAYNNLGRSQRRQVDAVIRKALKEQKKNESTTKN